MKYSMTIAAAALFAASAGATPVTTPPPSITALGGNVTAYYVFADAGDTSVLSLGATNLFCNHNYAPASCSAATSGQAVSLGTITAGTVLNFELKNKTTGINYFMDTADIAGDYHAKVSSNYADFGVGALPGGAASALAGKTVTFVAFEDRQASNGSDFDYNDLIFAFTNVEASHNPGVPEPLTLSLMGAGLLGAFGLRRAKKS